MGRSACQWQDHHRAQLREKVPTAGLKKKVKQLGSDPGKRVTRRKTKGLRYPPKEKKAKYRRGTCRRDWKTYKGTHLQKRGEKKGKVKKKGTTQGRGRVPEVPTRSPKGGGREIQKRATRESEGQEGEGGK